MPVAKQGELVVVPITQKAAQRFIAKYHRHNLPSVGSIFVLGLECNGELIGVAMVGHPKSRLLMDGKTLEVTRVCAIEGTKNANSKIYAACARAAAALGYKRIITYTLPEESGASLKAAGWTLETEKAGSGLNAWEHHPRCGKGDYDLFGNLRRPLSPKRRWSKCL